MPYYIYKIVPGPTALVKNLEQVTSYEVFNDAKKHAREMRAELGTDTNIIVKVIFAATPLEAEDKLQEHREAPILREWEK
ncbi:MAG: hypothetical protein KKE76_12655 [Gammaproteobacteria bacterium]|nr:hypothetical protein [Gammaproteobacteria bacterium]